VNLHESCFKKHERDCVDVTIIAGKDIPKMDRIGHCDPYCLLELQRKDGTIVGGTLKTKIEYNTATARWNTKFRFGPISNLDYKIVVKLMDYDKITKNELIGQVDLKINDLPLDKERDYKVIRNGKNDAGVITIRAEHHRKRMPSEGSDGNGSSSNDHASLEGYDPKNGELTL